MPPKHHPHPKWKIQKTPLRSNERKTLSTNDVHLLASKMRVKFKWSNEPHPFQLDAVRAQLERSDIIIQAPTGAGKTAIAAGPHAWTAVSDAKMVTIMVSPLLSLEKEMVCFPSSSTFSVLMSPQVATFKTSYGLDVIAVHSQNGGCSYEVQQVNAFPLKCLALRTMYNQLNTRANTETHYWSSSDSSHLSRDASIMDLHQ